MKKSKVLYINPDDILYIPFYPDIRSFDTKSVSFCQINPKLVYKFSEVSDIIKGRSLMKLFERKPNEYRCFYAYFVTKSL